MYQGFQILWICKLYIYKRSEPKMEFRLMNGKMVQIDKSVKNPAYTWKMPNDNLNIKPTRNLMDVPMMPIREVSKQGVYANSSMVIGSTFVLAAINPENGIFWETFMKYIFPWFLDIAKVFCAIKVAQAFYQENRGGRDSGSGMGSLVIYGKWLLLFHLIPWGVTLIDQIGKQMFNDLN
jgi:hypothetical protein